MFTFESKGKSITLRPEGTAGCMRMAIETGLLDAGQEDYLIKAHVPIRTPSKRSISPISTTKFGGIWL